MTGNVKADAKRDGRNTPIVGTDPGIAFDSLVTQYTVAQPYTTGQPNGEQGSGWLLGDAAVEKRGDEWAWAKCRGKGPTPATSPRRAALGNRLPDAGLFGRGQLPAGPPSVVDDLIGPLGAASAAVMPG